MSNLTRAIQDLAPTALLELFELDLTPLGGDHFYFHCGTNELGTSVIWKSVAYIPLPVQISGIEVSGQGKLPRPTLTVSNLDGSISALLRGMADLVTAKVIRRRVLAGFLDAANFASGNPDADPLAEWPADLYSINRKIQEDKDQIQFELVSAIDMDGHQVPAAQVLPICTYEYRKAGECPYAGPAVAKADDTPTTDLLQDACGGRLSSCKLRFGEHGNLPSSAFPGANQIPS